MQISPTYLDNLFQRMTNHSKLDTVLQEWFHKCQMERQIAFLNQLAFADAAQDPVDLLHPNLLSTWTLGCCLQSCFPSSLSTACSGAWGYSTFALTFVELIEVSVRSFHQLAEMSLNSSPTFYFLPSVWCHWLTCGFILSHHPCL